MQSQPQDPPRQSDRKRARQAARLSDDVFKGGEGAGAPAGRLSRPWNVGARRLWEAARRRQADQSES